MQLSGVFYALYSSSTGPTAPLRAAAEFSAPTMVSSDKAACSAAPPSNPPMDNNNRFAPVDTPQKKAPKCANKKASKA